SARRRGLRGPDRAGRAVPPFRLEPAAADLAHVLLVRGGRGGAHAELPDQAARLRSPPDVERRADVGGSGAARGRGPREFSAYPAAAGSEAPAGNARRVLRSSRGTGQPPG